jgi:orotate phosphoribosyltransferase-like protein
VKLNKKIEEIEKKIESLKAKGIDTYDIEIELNIAKDKVKTGAFKMAETYLESVEKRIEKPKK